MKLEINIDCPDDIVADTITKLLPILSAVGGEIRLPKSAHDGGGKADASYTIDTQNCRDTGSAKGKIAVDVNAPKLLGTYKYKVLNAAAADTTRFYTIDELMAATGLTREQVRSAATDAFKTRGEMKRDEHSDTPRFKIIDKGIENLRLHRLAVEQNAGKASAA